MSATRTISPATFAGCPAAPMAPDFSTCASAPTVGRYGALIGGIDIDAPAQSVRMPPGSRTVTLIPSGPTSCARTSENPPTAHLADWYAARPAVATRPPSDDT